MKKTILFVLPSLAGGGVERVVTVLMRHWDRSHWDIHLLLINAAGPLLDEVPADVTRHDFHHKRIRLAAVSVIKTIRRVRPDVVLSPMGYVNLFLLLLKPFFPNQTRLIIREANTPSATLGRQKGTAIFNFLYRKFYPKADGVLCQSQSVADEISRSFGVKRDKIRVVANPVDIRLIQSEVAHASSPWGVSDKRHLIAAGRLVPQKGFDTLIRAFALLRRRIPDVDLTILGDGPDFSTLTDLAKRLDVADDVHLKGFEKNPWAYFANADLFVLSSRWEGQPNAVLEALACGTPVVACEAAATLREIIQEGENGWLVPIADEKSLALAMEKGLEKSAEMKSKGEFLPVKYRAENAVPAYEEAIV